MDQSLIDTLATTIARIEEAAYPSAVILPNFQRSLQLDQYSCGAKSLYSIFRYYNKRCTPKSIEKALNTDEDGTSVSDIKRVVKRYGLTCRTLRDLKAAIDHEHPVLISMYDGKHYGVIYGYSKNHVFIMNPSLDFTRDGVGSIKCAIRKQEFNRIWDKYGLVIAQ